MLEAWQSIPPWPNKFEALRPVLNERARRRWASTEALAFGRGGISAVAGATGLSRKTIRAGIHEMRLRRVRRICPRDHADAASWSWA